MPKVAVYDMSGKQVGDIELSDSIFGIEPNKPVLHMSVINYLANQRQGTQSTLTRAEVSGGGRKPWKQKGTGRARQGSIRSPQWTHGGIALGPKPRSYRFALNKKVRRLAMKSAFSIKVSESKFIVVDNMTVNEIKTKAMLESLKALGFQKKALMVLPTSDEKIIKSARNIEGVKTTLVNTLSVYDILNCDLLIIARDAVAKLEEVYAS